MVGFPRKNGAKPYSPKKACGASYCTDIRILEHLIYTGNDKNVRNM